jgi:hypothetical protein
MKRIPLALALAFVLAQAAAAEEGIVVSARAPSPLDNPDVVRVARQHLGNLPDGILAEREQIQARINSRAMFGENDAREQRLVDDLGRLYGIVKIYDRRTLKPQAGSELEEPCMINTALGAFVYSVDLSAAPAGAKGKKGAPQLNIDHPGDSGVFVRPVRDGESLLLKLVVGIKTPEQPLSPLRPLASAASPKIKYQTPAGLVRLAPIYSQDSQTPTIKGEFDLNYLARRPEAGVDARYEATLYLKASTIQEAGTWHLQVVRRNGKDVLKKLVLETKEILALADLNSRLGSGRH